MIKKLLVLTLSLLLAVSLFACGGGNDTGTAASTDKPQTETEKTDDTQPSNAETNANTQDVTEADAPTDTEAATEPEEVKGNENLEISEKIDYVMITGKGECDGKDIIIPSHINGKPVTVIDEDAFRESDITSIVIPWTVTKIDEDAFVDCKDLSSVTLSEGLRYISTSAFYGCAALKSITLPASIERIASYAFRFCSALEEVVILGDTTLDNNVFSDCESLSSITFKSPGAIPYELGSNICPQASLKTLIFSEGLTKIGSWAFADTTALTEVYLPASLTVIDACAFLRSGIVKVYYAGSEEQWKSIEIKNSNDPLNSAEIIYDYK
ncbi:MAG: leucine-rich repeat domain-containing protein [Clostridia bacterium]|nr:leucine-rich repeat domain-containing protein [Clostridia bacterium]